MALILQIWLILIYFNAEVLELILFIVAFN